VTVKHSFAFFINISDIKHRVNWVTGGERLCSSTDKSGLEPGLLANGRLAEIILSLLEEESLNIIGHSFILSVSWSLVSDVGFIDNWRSHHDTSDIDPVTILLVWCYIIDQEWRREIIVLIIVIIDIINGLHVQWDHLATEKVLTDDVGVLSTHVRMTCIELLHESSKVFDMLIHVPNVFFLLTSDKAVSCTNLGIKDHEVGPAVPGVWIVPQCWNTSSGLVNLELVWTHLTE